MVSLRDLMRSKVFDLVILKGVYYMYTEFKKTTMSTATGTSLNKSFYGAEQWLCTRYKSLYISLPSSAKQQREIALSGERERRLLIF